MKGRMEFKLPGLARPFYVSEIQAMALEYFPWLAFLEQKHCQYET